MATKRKSLSPRTRFEIFKRDGFRCIYCGATPLNATLQVDHVVAVASGGTDDPANLVTSCGSCNSGKSAVPLERRRYDAGPQDREHLEQMQAYLAYQREIAELRKQAANDLAAFWESRVGPMSQDMFDRLEGLMREWPTDRLTEAVVITAAKKGAPGSPFDSYTVTQQAKYFHGILRRWRAEGRS
jgi:hypothetical protein